MSLGEHRLLFGTGMPFHYPGPALAKLDMLDAPERVKSRIRSENVRQWLEFVQRVPAERSQL